MKRSWIRVVMAGIVLSGGCATALEGQWARGQSARSRPGHTTTFQKGPVYVMRGGDYHSLSDRVSRRASPAGPIGMATARAPMPGPDDSPLVEWGILGFGVKGLPGADIRRLGVKGYAKNWAELGLGRSVAEISHDPSTIYIYVQVRFFNRGSSRMLLY